MNWQDEAHRRLGHPRPGDIGPGDDTCYFKVYDGENWVTTGNCTVSETAVINFMRASKPAVVWNRFLEPEPKPCWRLSLVEVREEELEGLDRSGFRDLVRGKLQVVGDDLMKAWEERNGGG